MQTKYCVLSFSIETEFGEKEIARAAFLGSGAEYILGTTW